MKMQKKTTSVSTPELAVELSNFNISLIDCGDEKLLAIDYDWSNPENGKSGSKHRYWGVLSDDLKALNTRITIAKREVEMDGSIAIFGSDGLLQTAISDGVISKEIIKNKKKRVY